MIAEIAFFAVSGVLTTALLAFLPVARTLLRPMRVRAAKRKLID